jgi:hypothetical protein
MERKPNMRVSFRGVRIYLWALASVFVGGVVGRAVGGVAGIVLGILSCLGLMAVLALADLIVSAWWAARRERIERTRRSRGE